MINLSFRSLYKEAVQRSDADTMYNLLLTGQCDLKPLQKLLNNTGQAPLSIFACKGVLGGLKYLLEKGNIDANQKDFDQKTPLHWAALNGHIDIARQLLLVEHVRATEKDKNGNTALLLATGASNTCSDMVLSADFSDECLEMCLAAGASNECPEMVQLIVNDSIGQFSVNISNNNKSTPLMVAICASNMESSKILLSSMATDVSCLHIGGGSALHFAAFMNNWQCATLILQRKDGRDGINQFMAGKNFPLMLAVKKNSKEVVNVLLDTPGINVNQCEQFGVTALHNAIKTMHIECLRMLLQTRGIDCNVVNRKGATPLHLAATSCSPEMTLMLLAKPGIKAQVKVFYAPDGCYMTPLDIANKARSVRTAAVLERYEKEHPISDSDDN